MGPNVTFKILRIKTFLEEEDESPSILDLAAWIRVSFLRGLASGIGGRAADGEDATNELSWLLLDVTDSAQLVQPTLSLRWHHKIHTATKVPWAVVGS